MGLSPFGLTICGRGRKSWVQRDLGSSQMQGPWQFDPLLQKLDLGHGRQSFNHVPSEAEDIDSEWTAFCTSIVEAANRSNGHKVIGNPQTHRWTLTVRDAIELKE